MKRTGNWAQNSIFLAAIFTAAGAGCAPMNSADPSAGAASALATTAGDKAGIAVSTNGNHVVWATFDGETNGTIAVTPNDGSTVSFNFGYLTYTGAHHSPVVAPSTGAKFYIMYEKVGSTHMNAKPIEAAVQTDGALKASMALTRSGTYNIHIHCVDDGVDDDAVVQVEVTS